MPKGGGWLILIIIDKLISNHRLSKNPQEKLCLYFSLRHIIDNIAIHGMYVILGCMINTLELDKHINTKLLKRLTIELFEKEFSINYKE